MTPTLSDQEFFDGLPLAGGRLSVSLLELKRRMEAELPLRIAQLNARLGLNGSEAYKPPKDYVLAPVSVDDRFINNLIIGFSTRMPEHGAMYRKETALQIYIPDKRIEFESQVTDALDRSEIILRVLTSLRGGCTDMQGRKAWDGLSGFTQTVLPEAWKNYSGICIECAMKATPTPNIWSEK